MPKRKKAAPEPELKSWIVPMEYTFRGEVIVEATDVESARQVALNEMPEMEPVPELVNWTVTGEPEENT